MSVEEKLNLCPLTKLLFNSNHNDIILIYSKSKIFLRKMDNTPSPPQKKPPLLNKTIYI